MVVTPYFLLQTEPGALKSTKVAASYLVEVKLSKAGGWGCNEDKSEASPLHPSLLLTNEVLD